MKIHKEGYGILLITVAICAGIYVGGVALLGSPLGNWIFGILSVGLFLLILQFFRYPQRKINLSDYHLVCPADGKVVVIEKTTEKEFFKDERIQVSIFMSPLNVHVNFTPMKGVVEFFKYHPGKFLVAWHPKSSEENERTTVVVKNDTTSILFRQIAGALARRIRWYIKEGDTLNQGQEFGFIRFGSRVDIFLPLDAKVKVNIGDKVIAQKTVLAEL